jgi:mono/diheme cytochrome c family protein
MTAGCHNSNLGLGEEAFILIDYPSISQHVVADHPENSDLYTILSSNGDNPMPPAGPMSSSDIELLRKWIAEGALNSDCPSNTCDTSGAIGYNSHVKSIIDPNCKGCHNASNLSGNVNLDGYDNVKHYATTVKPSTSTNFLLGTIKQMAGFSAMPKYASKLDDCSIRKIELWISQGTPQ